MSDERDDETGQFVQGNTASKGARPRAPNQSELIRDYLAPKKQAVLDKITELAGMGDGPSMRIFMDYLAPKARPETEVIVVPGIEEAEGIPAKIELTLNAAMSGLINADQAKTLLSMLETASRALAPEKVMPEVKIVSDFDDDWTYPATIEGEAETVEAAIEEFSPVSDVERPLTFVEAIRVATDLEDLVSSTGR
jgi:hypothetical protein